MYIALVEIAARLGPVFDFDLRKDDFPTVFTGKVENRLFHDHFFQDVHYFTQHPTVTAMGKRTSEAADLPASKSAAKGQETARPATQRDDDGMGEFEDNWEDEMEEEEEIVEGAEDEEGGEGEFVWAQIRHFG